MQSRDFIYWLQGFFEISNADTMSADQVAMVKNHLNLVFKHEIDPAMGDTQHQATLDAVHSPGKDRPVMRC